MTEELGGSDQTRRDGSGKRLYRSATNKQVAGVCGGVSEITGIDVSLIRLLWILWIFLGGSGLLVYILLAIIVPERPAGVGEPIVVGDRWQELGPRAGIVLGALVILIGAVLMLNSLGWLPVGLGAIWRFFWRLFWPLALIGVGLFIVVGAFYGDRGWWRNVRLPAAGTVLRRSRSERMVAGVCGGLATYFNIDPTLVRLLWAIASLSTAGAGLLAYIVAVLVLPEE